VVVLVSAFLTTKSAAERLGVTPGRVRALITAQRLPATKAGRDWLINEADLALVAERKPGAPRKENPKRVTKPRTTL
jgi:excisionase family DNA binding protein